MGAIIEKNYSYAAFISYAHADERAAKKLHGALETYPLPKDMRSWDKEPQNRAKLKPIFRDVTELTAHHSLSEKIRDAVKTSRFLIVLCSPAAKKSHWVNEEIRLFRSLHGESSILAVIVQGNPNTAFPPALTEAGREPLAADISGKEGFRFGVSQLAASMLGVGLDQLIRRDQKRRRLRTQLVSGTASALALIMGGLAYTAIDARDDAQAALDKAEVSRDAAEEMVEFMIGDLKNDLTPIQKLDLFDGIGKRVADYYDAIPLEDMDDDRMMRRARSLHILGDVEINRGNYEKAEEILKQAYVITEDVYIRNSENTTAIFAHAQSEYWMGWMYKEQTAYETSIHFMERYKTLGRTLHLIEEKNLTWAQEAAWGATNFATINLRMEKFQQAKINYELAIKYFEQILQNNESDFSTLAELANVYSGAAQAEVGKENFHKSIEYMTKSADIFQQISKRAPNNYHWKFLSNQALFRLERKKGISVCNNENYKKLFEQIAFLTSYDPDNFEWKKEFMIQWKLKIESCENTSILFDSREFQEFLKMAQPHLDDVLILQLVEELNPLIEKYE